MIVEICRNEIVFNWFTVNSDLEDDDDEVSGLDEEITYVNTYDIYTDEETASVDIVHMPGSNFLTNFDPHYNLYHQYVLARASKMAI